VGQGWKKNREFKKTPGHNKMGNIKRFICVYWKIYALHLAVATDSQEYSVAMKEN
jgi:hypothetical protein